jgi:Zn-dependent protease with chaperone function
MLMKDITISASRIKKELITLLFCFFIGFIANVGAVIYYNSAATEIITSIPYVLVFMFVIYSIWSLLRIIKWLVFSYVIKK